ncbi:hypothetical protein [Frigoriglobus tundricola]|uniref:hypothetical protein n=1 Tax=Frigoriglobus tundricola TaxID=2774151 RepID=UPI00148E9E43|nr:hypothetical protein [Frigoriglobus tundricola]
MPRTQVRQAQLLAAGADRDAGVREHDRVVRARRFLAEPRGEALDGRGPGVELGEQHPGFEERLNGAEPLGVVQGREEGDEVPDLPPRLPAEADEREELPRGGRLVLDAAVHDRRVGDGRGGLIEQLVGRHFGARAHELVRDRPQERLGVPGERLAAPERPVDFVSYGHRGVVVFCGRISLRPLPSWEGAAALRRR